MFTRRQLIDQATEAFNAGQIDRQELRQIKIASLAPGAMSALREGLPEMAMDDGLIESTNSIDWASLIKTLLPLILQILKMFL